MVLQLWINGCRHNFSTHEGFDLVVGVASGSVELSSAGKSISRRRVQR
jgi:death-on-curing protein